MKKKHLYLLIAMLTVAAVLPIIILVCFSSANEPQRPVTIIYRNTEYAYKEFLAGCVLSCLKTLDEPPADDESEGINAVAVALEGDVVIAALFHQVQGGVDLRVAVGQGVQQVDSAGAQGVDGRGNLRLGDDDRLDAGLLALEVARVVRVQLLRNMPYRLTLPYRKGQPFSPSAAFRRA